GDRAVDLVLTVRARDLVVDLVQAAADLPGLVRVGAIVRHRDAIFLDVGAGRLAGNGDDARATATRIPAVASRAGVIVGDQLAQDIDEAAGSGRRDAVAVVVRSAGGRQRVDPVCRPGRAQLDLDGRGRVVDAVFRLIVKLL